MAHILLIDDEEDIIKLLSLSVTRMGHSCDTASNFSQAIELLNQQQFDMCITDKNLPDGDGLDIIRHIEEKSLNTPTAMITAYGNLDTAVDAMKAGAFDFIPKPVSLISLKKLIQAALKSGEQATEAPIENTSESMVGSSPAIKHLKMQVFKVAKNQAPVFIHGESGSGKELVARMIHNKSSRRDAPFIAVNCGAIPTELMESEFFGHTRGSFTGAINDKPGLFAAAESGTLFLDEVAELPLNMQVKLLRTLQEKTYRPIGATDEHHSDVRILSASHKSLEQEIISGRFREDLFYRINVIEIDVPPLRHRASDIKTLSEYLLNKVCSKYDLPPTHLSEEALEKLTEYQFPGNVRELENMLERAVTLCEDNSIDACDLSFGRRERTEPMQSETPNSDQTPSKNAQSFNIEDAIGQYDKFIEDIEKATITMALEKTRWNKTQAAELLGISFRTLRYKVSKLDI